MNINFHTFISAVLSEPVRRFFAANASKIVALAVGVLGAFATGIFARSRHPSSHKMPTDKKVVVSTNPDQKSTHIFQATVSQKEKDSKKPETIEQPTAPLLQKRLNDELAQFLKARKAKSNQDPEVEKETIESPSKQQEVSKSNVEEKKPIARTKKQVRIAPSKKKSNTKATKALENLPKQEGNLEHLTKDRPQAMRGRRPPSKKRGV